VRIERSHFPDNELYRNYKSGNPNLRIADHPEVVNNGAAACDVKKPLLRGSAETYSVAD
jgi:hypothetical protein